MQYLEQLRRDATVPTPSRLHAGGYWSLDKRHGDLTKMEAEWAKWQRGMRPLLPELASDTDVRALAERLHSLAHPLCEEIQAARDAHGSCLMHGDFKAANLFLRTAPPPQQAASESARDTIDTETAVVAVAPEVAACDFQWAGRGLGVQDVAYLLWTSVRDDVMPARERELVAAYHGALTSELRRSGQSVAPELDRLWSHYEVRGLRVQHACAVHATRCCAW